MFILYLIVYLYYFRSSKAPQPSFKIGKGKRLRHFLYFYYILLASYQLNT